MDFRFTRHPDPETGCRRQLQMSFFDQTDLVEIAHPDFPGERLVACFNPLLAEERARRDPSC